MSSNFQRVLTISNLLTLSRILLTPFIAVGILRHEWFLAFTLFFIAVLTDFLDGYIARAFSECTTIGTTLDPIADKILLLATFASFVFSKIDDLVMPLWFLIFAISRELIIVLGAILISWFVGNIRLQPTIWGKTTTLLQIIFILWYFTCLFYGWVPVKTYAFALVAISAFSFFSLAHYVRIGIRYMRIKGTECDY